MNLINFYSKENLYKITKFYYNKDTFKLLAKNNISVNYFYKENKSIELTKDDIDKIENTGAKINPYLNYDDLKNQLMKFGKNIFLNTMEEQEVLFVNKLRRDLGQETTNDPEIFINKYIQRNKIGSLYPETVVNYKFLEEKDLDTIDFDKPILNYPFIIKPAGGLQSSGVYKIYNKKSFIKGVELCKIALQKLKEKRLGSNGVLLEEYITGKGYSIDYFVDKDQHITMSKPVFLDFGIDYGLKDFCNISRIISKEVEETVDKRKLDEFVKKTILGGGIRNTFMHHEFKIDNNGEFKTLETNGRIGGYRQEMYKLSYNINLLLMPFIKNKNIDFKLYENVSTFVIYPKQEQMFVGFNSITIDKIKLLKSFFRINYGVIKNGDIIGSVSKGFSKVGSIILKNKDYDEFLKDVKFIRENYFNILNN